MRRFQHILLLSLLIGACFTGRAQTPQNLDQDIRALRHAAIPGFHCAADDYTQYAPAAVVLGLKACGYEGRTGWGQMLVSDAFSIAIMTGVTQGVKYSVRRMRPDDSRRNSFPSGHTGTSFLTATMLHKEYGWRSPWWSIGGYTVAAFTGVSRILNNKHWMSDITAGAAIGIGSVHLGYYLSDLIFKGKYINPAYEAPTFCYDPDEKHYVAELYFARRFILGDGIDFFTGKQVLRGGSAGLSTNIPVIPGIGVAARLGANSLTYITGTTADAYEAMAGGYYTNHFARRFDVQAKAIAGLAWMPVTSDGLRPSNTNAASISAGVAFGFMLDDNFKIQAFSDYQTIGGASDRWLHSILVGWSAAWVW